MNAPHTAAARQDAGFRRFFGKDITNIEDGYLQAKDTGLKDRHPARSHVKTAEHEQGKQSQSKPSPMQFCKVLLDH